jgi:hypothetical protein
MACGRGGGELDIDRTESVADLYQEIDFMPVEKPWSDPGFLKT